MQNRKIGSYLVWIFHCLCDHQININSLMSKITCSMLWGHFWLYVVEWVPCYFELALQCMNMPLTVFSSSTYKISSQFYWQHEQWLVSLVYGKVVNSSLLHIVINSVLQEISFALTYYATGLSPSCSDLVT